jgi:MSHA biogenesis protein MshE
MIASTVLAVLSQRLVRLICRYCIERYSPGPDELEWVKHYAPDQLAHAKFQRGKGCTRCNGVGYTGRTGVYEMIEMTAPLAAAIHGSDSREFERVAREQQGRNTIARHALDLLFAGETTIAEAMQVVTSAEG